MYIFIDESGIHKNNGFSTIAIIIVIPEHVKKYEKEILDIEAKLNINSFHWTYHKWSIRSTFIKSVFKINENIVVKVISKNNPSHYFEFLSASLGKIINEYNITRIILDGEKTHSYERSIKKILRQNAISTRILFIKRDESSPLLRFADAIAGLTRFYLEDPEHPEAKKLFEFVQSQSTHYLIHYL